MLSLNLKQRRYHGNPAHKVQKRSLKALAAAILIAPLMAACAFQPLYGPTASGNNLNETMKSVVVAPIPGRVGQRLRNELIFKTTGGGYNNEGLYKLEVVVRESVRSILVEQSGDAQGQTYVLQAKFKLIDKKSGKSIFNGSAQSRASFDKFESIFANTRARLDAEQRAARTIADTIKTRLATFLSRTS